MFLDEYHTRSGDQLSVSGAQASRFAKEVANDFNPIHDEDAKRFCVPGDLLFALSLASYGLSKHMVFTFGGMVGANTALLFPQCTDATLSINDVKEKHYLSVTREGETVQEPHMIEAFIRQYVAFSGQNFPHILVPLMRDHDVMINPARPLVIYESMEFSLDTLGFSAPQLKLVDSTLDVAGKRGNVNLNFDVLDAGVKVGHGVKRLVLSGLRAFDEPQMEGICDYYAGRKQRWLETGLV